MPEELLNVPTGSPPAVQVAFPQTRKSIVPVSAASGSVNVAVSVGVAVVLYVPFAGLTSVGVSGATSVTTVNEKIPLALEVAFELSVLVARQKYVVLSWRL